MLTRNLLHRIFRHSPRQKVSEDTLPRRFKQPAAERAGPAVEASSGPASPYKERKVAMYTIAPAPKTPEPFGLENIAEEDADDTSSPNDTASLTETLASLELETSTFSARELVRATLDEAKTAVTFHLDTINTTLALLEALDGFSATISELSREMLEKKQRCEGQLTMLDAVERAVEDLNFAGEAQEEGFVDSEVQ